MAQSLSIAVSLMLALVFAPNAAQGSTSSELLAGPVRRVYAPYFAGDIRFSQTATFWFGQVTPVSNYTDVRVGYNHEELWVHVASFDRRLWYDTTPSSETLRDWDSATLLIGLDGDVGATVTERCYRFTGQLNWGSWEGPRTPWQSTWRGDGVGWSAASTGFTTNSGWRGEAPNTNSDDRGWQLTFRVPFASLGQSGKPRDGTTWGMAILVHDRDDASGALIPDQKWPAGSRPETPATWGQLVFGQPSFAPARAASRHLTMIRHGLDGANVADSAVGGNANCGGGMDRWTEWGNKNYAGLDYFNVQNQFDVSDWPCFSKYYVTFPLDRLPTRKTIISAALQLHQFGNAGAGWNPGPTPSYIQVLTVSEDWDETTLTWNNAPMAELNIAGAWVNPFGEPVPPAGADRQWDVSGAVAEAYAAGRPVRLAVYSGDWDYHSGRYFRSSEFWDPVARPTLFVAWGDPILEGHSTWLPLLRH